MSKFDWNKNGKRDIFDRYMDMKIMSNKSKDNDIDDFDDDEYSWRENYSYDFEFQIDPEDYETEEEYLEALDEAKYSWREKYKFDYENITDPNDYETEEEYLEALDEEKYSWRKKYEFDFDNLTRPEDYESEEEYIDALDEEKYSWRVKYFYNHEYMIEPEEYETEEEYLEAIKEVKYSWRDDYDLDNDVDPEEYETEEEYLEALDGVYSENEDISDLKIVEIIDVKKEKEVMDISNIYDYCKVALDLSNEKYDYLCGELKLNINDRVIIPLGNENNQVLGTVVAVGKCLACALPSDISKMKNVIRLFENDENTQINTPSKKDLTTENIIYEDQIIKISLIKWEFNIYLAGSARAGTFLFENKYKDRVTIFFKNISIEGFLNQEESIPTALPGNTKEIKSISFVFDKKVPDHLKSYKEIEFKVCYGRIKEGYSAPSLIEGLLIESDIITLKL